MKVILIPLVLMTSVYGKWDFHKQYDSTAIYKSDNGSRLIVEQKATAKKEKTFSMKFLKEIEKKKERMLTFLGVRNWKVSDRNILKKDNYTELTFSGSYLDRKGKSIYFYENHVYKETSKIQVLITNENQKDLNKDLDKGSLEKIKNKYEL